MKNIRGMWWAGAIALLVACDPYDDEPGGAPAVLSVMASVASDPEAPSDAFADAIVDDVALDGFALADVPTGNTVFVVKTNKLLDGLSIQTAATDCRPAAGLNLQIDGVAAPVADAAGTCAAGAGACWFACYQPGSATTAEASALVIYQGIPVTAGVEGSGGSGYLASASLAAAPAPIRITAQPKDKAGNTLDVNFTVATAAP